MQRNSLWSLRTVLCQADIVCVPPLPFPPFPDMGADKGGCGAYSTRGSVGWPFGFSPWFTVPVLTGDVLVHHFPVVQTLLSQRALDLPHHPDVWIESLAHLFVPQKPPFPFPFFFFTVISFAEMAPSESTRAASGRSFDWVGEAMARGFMRASARKTRTWLEDI